MIIINRKQIYINGILSEMEEIEDEISLMESGRFAYDEQIYKDKEFLVHEYDKIRSMKEDDIIVIGYDE